MNYRFNAKKTKYIKPINAVLKLFVHEKQKQAPTIDKYKSIAVLDISLIGDEIMNIPFYRTIKRNIPDCKLTVIGKPWIKDQLIEEGVIDSFVEFDGLKILESPKSWLKNRNLIKSKIKEINRAKYDLVIEPRGDIRYILFMHKINADYKVSYDYMNADYMLTKSIKGVKEKTHEIDARLNILAQLGFEVLEKDRIPILKPSNSQCNSNNKFIETNGIGNKKVIGIHPGASLAVKQYPFFPNAIDELLNDISDKDEYCLLVFCGHGEENIAKSVVEVGRQNGIQTILCQEPLRDYIGRIAICDYMICNDSGAGHIAASYGKPVVVIFGPIDPAAFKPRGEGKVITISHNLECKPCAQRQCQLGTNACIKSINPNEVVSAIKNIMNL